MAQKGILGKSEFKDRDKRPIRWRKYPFLFLVVCEDEKTEPFYFKSFVEQFPEETIFLRAVGTGKNSKGVVEQAIIERKKLAEESNKNVDETWAVFDKDDAEKNLANAVRFSEAFKIAQEEKIKVAYSNEVFELWVLLHLADVNSTKPIPRSEIYSSIEGLIRSFLNYENFAYEHGKIEVIEAMFKVGDETKAIERAEKLLALQKGKLPIESNPSTTMHILVRRLRELIEWYSYSPT